MKRFQLHDFEFGEFYAGGPRGATPETCWMARQILSCTSRGNLTYRSYNMRTGEPHQGIGACSPEHMRAWAVRKPTPEEMDRMTPWIGKVHPKEIAEQNALVEAVLRSATDDQLRAELERREMIRTETKRRGLEDA